MTLSHVLLRKRGGRAPRLRAVVERRSRPRPPSVDLASL